MTGRLHRLIDATSQWSNVLLFNGEANYSISGDAYRLNRPRLRAAIDMLMRPIETDHCRKSYLADIERAAKLLEQHKTGSPNA